MTARNQVSGTSGNASTLVSGSTIAGPSIFMGQGVQKLAQLSSLVSYTLATATLTFTAKWQVSKDNATWIDVAPANNAANVSLGTGTLAAAQKVLDAPFAIYAWPYARVVLITGGTTGNTGDLWAFAWNYRQLVGGDIPHA